MARTLALALALLGLCAAGCGKDSDEVEIDRSGRKITITTKEGTHEIGAPGAVALVDGFPDDVHVYEPGSIITSGRDGKGFMVTVQTKASPAEVLATYKENMAAGGWTEKRATNMPMGAARVYTKGEREARLAVISSGDLTTVTVVVSGPAAE